MKICVCLCTFRRPVSLGHVIRCFERQSHPDREMVILDDAGQHGPRRGDRWELLSIGRRFRTLGEKRNALAALAPADAEALAIWDDDDLYFPWALEASAAALARADWSRPSVVLHPLGRPRIGQTIQFRQHQTGGLYHGGWAYRRRLFDAAGWYPADSGPEDQRLMRKMEALSPSADPIALGFRPFYVFGGKVLTGRANLSALGCNQGAYDCLGRLPAPDALLEIADPPGVDLDEPVILPTVYPRPF
jgi:hypothetical protein